jgi:iron complex outermembrane recepter protein
MNQLQVWGGDVMTSVRTTLLLAGASTLAFAWTANAQTAASNQLEEIVITGSRVITNGNDSPTPVTVVTTEDLKTVNPGNIVEALNDMPAFNGSRGQNTNSGTGGQAGSPANSANAGNQLNLRQLGTLRSLVLYDGHRAPPSLPNGDVDLDTIPQMMLKRVDVVTGGVSAVYGSDGISGAINFVTDTSFQGIKGNLQAGRSAYNDADTAEGGIAFGTNLFGGRGHVMGSFESRHSAPIDSKFARPWGKNVYTLQGFGTDAVPYFQVSGARTADRNAAGRVNNSVFGDSQFTSGGYIIPFNHGTRLGSAPSYQASNNCRQCEIGGDGGVYNGQLRAGLDMNQFFGRFDFDFTDDLHGYLTVANTANHSVATGNYVTNSSYTITADNAFLLPQYKAALGSATTFTIGKMWTEIPRGEADTHTRQVFAVAGLQGSLGKYKWDVALTKSAGSFNVRQANAYDQGRFFAAIDSVVGPGGTPICRASLTNAAYANCVPLNPFGANAGSQAAVDYFMAQVNYETKIGMEDVSASLTGSPFDTWAGPVNAALSAEWRKTTYEIDSHTPDPRITKADCAGIATGCTGNTNVYNSAVISVPETSTKVSEAALEFGVPLLKDKAFAKSLDLNAAYRFAHYDRAGNANTWKVGFTWNPFDMLTVRATRSRDFRAPSLDENFRATTISAPGRGFGDVLPGNPDSAAGQNPLASTVNGGNLNLRPELGDTLSYGIVVRPTPNFDIAVDAFKIKVNDAIFLIQGNSPVYQRACYAGGGTSASDPGSSAYCQLIQRNAAGSVTQWTSSFINLANLETWGADIELGYRTSIADRPLQLRLLGTYQPHLIYKQPGIVDIDYAGSSFGTNGLQANPLWRFTGFASFKPTDNLTVSVQERWRSSLPKVDGNPTIVYSGKPVKSVAYTSVNVGYSPNIDVGKLEFFVNVRNLFNTDPPQAGFWGNPSPGQFGEIAFGDDPIGRFYTAGVRFQY